MIGKEHFESPFPGLFRNAAQHSRFFGTWPCSVLAQLQQKGQYKFVSVKSGWSTIFSGLCLSRDLTTHELPIKTDYVQPASIDHHISPTYLASKESVELSTFLAVRGTPTASGLPLPSRCGIMQVVDLTSTSSEIGHEFPRRIVRHAAAASTNVPQIDFRSDSRRDVESTSAQKVKKPAPEREAGKPHCAICLEDLTDGLCSVPCGHVFHLACMRHAYMRCFKKCPTCLRPIKNERQIGKIFLSF